MARHHTRGHGGIRRADRLVRPRLVGRSQRLVQALPMTTIDLVTGVLETLSARCAIAGHRSGSGDWLIRSPSPGRVKILAVSRGALWFRVVGASEAFLVSTGERSEEHTSELQSLMRISYAGFC